MYQLTCGERAVRCLAGEPVDRVPYGVGLGWVPWGDTVERWRSESGIPDLNPVEFFGFDGSFSVPAINSGMNPLFEHIVLEEKEDEVLFRDNRGILTRVVHSCAMHQWLEYPVKIPEDWKRIKEERWRIEDESRIGQDWDAFRAHLNATGAAVQVGHYPWGVFGSVRDLLGAEETLISFITEPEMVRDMMEHLTSLWISLWEKVSAEVRIDHIHIWEDMSGVQGSLISPVMVEEFMMPCYDRITDFARSKGVRLVSVDTDGDCSELAPIMTAHGVNVFFPFEVQAGNDILEYRKKYPELGIMGGLDKRALARDIPAVKAELEKAAKMVEMGRYIPGFDHLIPPDAKWECFRYAAEGIKEICGVL